MTDQFLFQDPAVLGQDLLGPGISSAANEELNKIYRRRINNITFRLLEENIVKTKDYITTTARVHKDKVANTLDEIWNSTGKKAVSAIKKAIFSVWMFLLAIVAPLLLVIVMAVILWAYCKYRLSRKAANELFAIATKKLRGVYHVDYEMQDRRHVHRDIEEDYPIPGVNAIKKAIFNNAVQN
ncbi:hypothetical protein CRE_20920 [Caenorhabditis remanei]|uniref:Uncharacterized protein n=1 Tax=Caenorhabditis remanei TaxID=31234 RepID=E3N915_CAERE|nr:hypothetical protein CRE_20920 [Caenorhabditis remanei]